jgi:hypothetical protein
MVSIHIYDLDQAMCKIQDVIKKNVPRVKAPKFRLVYCSPKVRTLRACLGPSLYDTKTKTKIELIYTFVAPAVLKFENNCKSQNNNQRHSCRLQKPKTLL